MRRTFALEYWQDDGWYVGRLKEVPGVFSQGQTLAELEENIQDAYEAMCATDQPLDWENVQVKEVELEV
jgi:predicted RNase H-like HicB family nuclease